jgi:MEDS: MEthanogen/methylotroph, DcmR Sensory domain
MTGQPFGLPGVTVQPGDHVCGLYFGVRERDEVLLPFLRAGLDAGDKCICVVDSTSPAHVLAHLGAKPDIDYYVECEQLQVDRAEDSYLRGDRFATSDMLDYLESFVRTATNDEGYAFVRVTGEATWVLRDPPGAEQLIAYESELNRFTPKYPQAVFCLYDLERFGGGMLVDLLKTHPKLLLGGLMLDNPNYLTPDEFEAIRM